MWSGFANVNNYLIKEKWMSICDDFNTKYNNDRSVRSLTEKYKSMKKVWMEYSKVVSVENDITFPPLFESYKSLFINSSASKIIEDDSDIFLSIKRD